MSSSLESTPRHLGRDIREELFKTGAYRPSAEPPRPHAPSEGEVILLEGPGTGSASEATPAIPSVPVGTFRRSRSYGAASSAPPMDQSAPCLGLQDNSNSSGGSTMLIRDMFNAGLFRAPPETLTTAPPRHRTSSESSPPPDTPPAYLQLLGSVFDSGIYRSTPAGESCHCAHLSAKHSAASAPVTPRVPSPVGCAETLSDERSALLESLFSDGSFRVRRGGGRGSASARLPPLSGRTTSCNALSAAGEKSQRRYENQPPGGESAAPDEEQSYDQLIDEAFIRGAFTRSAGSTPQPSASSSGWNTPSEQSSAPTGRWNIAPPDLALPPPHRERRMGSLLHADQGPTGSEGGECGEHAMLTAMFKEGHFRPPSKNNSFVGSEDGDMGGRSRLVSIGEHEAYPDLMVDAESGAVCIDASESDAHPGRVVGSSRSFLDEAFAIGAYRAPQAKVLGRL